MMHLLTMISTGGWDPSTGTIPSPTPAQINQAFANVELALRDAGAKRGWAHVFRVTSYHVPRVTPEALEAMVWNFEKYMPDHRPVWTCLGVSGLAEEGMMVEIEVVAHDPAEGGGGKKMI